MALVFIEDVSQSHLKGLRNHALGQAAESLVASHYERLGYALLAKRFRSSRGEVDLILQAPCGEFVFVEVKSSKTHDLAANLITPSQVRRVKAAAMDYLAQTFGHLDVDQRFDLALIDAMARLEVVENVFY